MTDRSIRRYRDGDAARLLELHESALRAADALVPEVPSPDDLRAIPETYLDAGGEFLVGTCAGEVVAMGGLERVDDETAEIRRMRTDPACQRRGYGRRILGRLEARATDLGYRTLVLETTTLQPAARRFYEEHGYVETGRHALSDFEVVAYRKRL